MDSKKKYNNLHDCVVDAQNGVGGAFDALYSMTYPYAYSAATRLLKNKSDIEDALQSSFYYVSRHLPDLRDSTAYLTWLNRIVINECKKILIDQNKHAKIFFAEKNRLIMSDEVNSDKDILEKSDLSETVNKILDEMKPEKSEILKLYYQENLSYSEISDKLGIPIGTVMSRLHNAKKELEKKIKELQKDGTILWSFPVIPLVAALLAYNVKANVTAPLLAETLAGVETISAATAAGASATAGTAATGTAATIGAGTASTAAAVTGTSVAVKAAAVAVAATLAAGGGVAAKKVISNAQTRETTTLAYTVENLKNGKNDNEFTGEFIIDSSPETKTEAKEELGTAESVTTAVPEATTDKKSSQTSETSVKDFEKAESSSTDDTTKRTRVNSLKTTTQSETTTASKNTTAATTETTVGKTTTKSNNTTTTIKVAATTADSADSFSVSGGVIKSYSGSGTSVTIPSSVGGETVTAIGAGAFEGQDIKSVTISSGITKIGQTAFSDCTKLTYVSLPSTLTSIGDCAFDGCSSLTSITIPDSVTNIGDDAFDGSDNLTIKCSEGSAAYEYAVENSIDYILI